MVRRRARRASSLLALLFGGILGGVLLSSPAFAEAPVDFGPENDVVDTAGVLGGDRTEVQDRLDELQQQTGITLLVAFIDTPTDPTDIEAWSNQVAERNGLGDNNALLVVAVDARQYYFTEETDLSADQRNEIERQDIVPALGRGDWAEGAIGAADGIQRELTGATGSGSDSDAGSGGTSFNLLPTVLILGGFAAVIVVVVLLLRFRNTRRRRLSAEAEQKNLDLKAGGLLVELDDAVKTSAQEVGFAEAEFGEDAVATFHTVLDSATAKVREAFRIKQRLDDAVPETPAERRELTSQIIALCEAADAELDEQAADFARLRELGRSAPEALRTLTAEAEQLAGRVPDAEATVATLRSTYAESALADVADDPEQVRKLLAFIATQGEQAAQHLRDGKSGLAAVAVRGGEQALGQAKQLLDAVAGAGARLEAARAQVGTAAASLRSDVVEGRALPPASRSLVAGDLEAILRDAESALAAADGARDPAAALTTLTTVEQRIDGALAPVREEQQRIARAREALGRAVSSADAQVRAADDFITTRRGGIGTDARTRLSEARRHLDSARQLAESDPVQALNEARAADSMAASALTAARSDVNDFGQGYGSSGAGGGDLTGAILGGIIGGMLGGGGRSSSWSGSWSSGGGRRSSGGFSGGWSGGGSRRSGGGGGFGGSRGFGGSSGRRSGGGGRF